MCITFFDLSAVNHSNGFLMKIESVLRKIPMYLNSDKQHT